MWSSLPSNLRTVLGTALLLGLGVAAAAFTLSFFALRDAAQDPALAWGSGHAWLFPIGVDMALVFFEVLLLGASMVRITDHDRVVQYPRAIPFLLMLVAAAGTLYFNATHVPDRPPPRPGRPGGQHPGHPRPGLSAEDAGRRLRGRGHPPRSPGPGAQPDRPPQRRAAWRAGPRPPGPRRPRAVPAPPGLWAGAQLGAFARQPKRAPGSERW